MRLRASSSVKPAASSSAQISDAGRDHEGKFLRLRAAGLVHGAPIGAQEARLGVAFAGKRLRGLAGALGQLRPGQERASRARHVADRIEAEVDGKRRRVELRAR